MLVVFLTNQKDYEPFLAEVVFAFDGLENFGYCIATEFTEVAEKIN